MSYLYWKKVAWKVCEDVYTFVDNLIRFYVILKILNSWPICQQINKTFDPFEFW